MANNRVIKSFSSNGDTVIIRYPLIKDSDDLFENINSLVSERVFIDIQEKQTKLKEKKWLLSLLKDIKGGKSVALVAEINGKVVGLANVEREKSKSMSHVAHFGIALIKEARGRGIGEKLLRAIVAEAKKVLKIKIVTLSAFADNRPAVSLYRKCGFVKTETMRGGIKHYGKYLDRIHMIKYL